MFTDSLPWSMGRVTAIDETAGLYAAVAY